MLQAIIASIGYAGGVAIDKILLCRAKMSIRIFIPMLFVLLASITAFLLPRFGAVNWEMLNTRYLLIFLLLIVVVIIWNKFYYNGIKKESLHELELIMLLSPLATIISVSYTHLTLPTNREV